MLEMIFTTVGLTIPECPPPARGLTAVINNQPYAVEQSALSHESDSTFVFLCQKSRPVKGHPGQADFK